MMDKRTFLKSAALASLAPSVLAQTEAFPSRPIKLICPASAGIAIDACARYFAGKLAAKVGVPVNVENMPGAGGLLGFNAAARAKPDGYTLIFAGIPIYLLPLFQKEASSMFDPIKSFTPVARVCYVPVSFAVSAESTIHTMGDLVDQMKAKGGRIRYGSQGLGSTQHICSAVLNVATNTKAEHVLYKAASSGVIDVVANRIDFMCLSPTVWIPLKEAGKVRVLAVTGAQRQTLFPDVPTTTEAGFPDVDVKSQFDFMAPAGTPTSVVRVLEAALIEAGNSEDFKEWANKQMFLRGTLRSTELDQLRRKENDYWRRVVAQMPQ
ncbi:MAG: tripartite tricarboxylate transporter substrate binding protein [Pseudomonadota bacterium]